MADSSIAITGGAVDGFTQVGGDFRQAMVLGDAVNAYTATVDSGGRQYARLPHDTGRTLVSLTLSTTAPATTDTVASLTPVRAGVAGTAGTSIPVTAGKTLRVTGITASLRTTTTATPWAKLVLRMNPSGAAVVGSPQIVALGVGGTAAVIGNTANAQFDIPDGIEFSGAQQLALSVSGNVATNVLDVTVVGFEYTS